MGSAGAGSPAKLIVPVGSPSQPRVSLVGGELETKVCQRSRGHSMLWLAANVTQKAQWCVIKRSGLSVLALGLVELR